MYKTASRFLNANPSVRSLIREELPGAIHEPKLHEVWVFYRRVGRCACIAKRLKKFGYSLYAERYFDKCRGGYIQLFVAGNLKKEKGDPKLREEWASELAEKKLK